MNNFKRFQTTCVCGATTTKAFARSHDGKCKGCAGGKSAPRGFRCPDCGQATLSAYQKNHGYHCDVCTRQTDPAGYYNEVRGFND